MVGAGLASGAVDAGVGAVDGVDLVAGGDGAGFADGCAGERVSGPWSLSCVRSAGSESEPALLRLLWLWLRLHGRRGLGLLGVSALGWDVL